MSNYIQTWNLRSCEQEDEIRSRFVFQFLIWPQDVTLVRWTQSSGPLCLWQCLVKKSLLISEFLPPWFHLLAPRRPRLPSRWRRRWPLATTPQLPRSRTCPMVQLQEIPLPRLPLRQLPPSRLPPHQEQTYLNKSPTFDKQKLEFAKNWAYADSPRISQVFLPNWQQDLRLLNLKKHSFF